MIIAIIMVIIIIVFIIIPIFMNIIINKNKDLIINIFYYSIYHNNICHGQNENIFILIIIIVKKTLKKLFKYLSMLHLNLHSYINNSLNDLLL